MWTRRSENNNTPQPLDQWEFHIDPLLGWSICHAPWLRSIPLCIQHHIQLTSLSIQVTAISIFYLENPRLRSKFEVTMWVEHSIDSHPFSSMSIGRPIPEIQIFQTLTLKIQGLGHGRGEHWKSQHGSNILSTHIPFVPCQSAIPFIR